MDASFTLICTAAGSAALWQATRWRQRRPRQTRRRQSLLKPHARYCYSSLRAACADEFSIQIDVPVSRLLAGQSSKKRRRGSRRPAPGRVDFVLCDGDTLRPRLAVLVASGDAHGRPAAHKATEKTLASADVPYIIIDAERELDPEELSEAIESFLADVEEPE